MTSYGVWTDARPDLIVRLGAANGERNSADFLPYQSQYAEWVYDARDFAQFADDAYALDAALHEFASRKRNYGK